MIESRKQGIDRAVKQRVRWRIDRPFVHGNRKLHDKVVQLARQQLARREGGGGIVGHSECPDVAGRHERRRFPETVVTSLCAAASLRQFLPCAGFRRTPARETGQGDRCHNGMATRALPSAVKQVVPPG